MIPMYFESAYNAFLQKIPVQQYTVSYVNGVWQETSPVIRNISGIILTLRPETLMLYSTGNNAVAGITIMTKSTLLYPLTTEASIGTKQDYITHQGIRFKVSGNALFGKNTPYNIYHAIYYLQ